MKMPPPEHPSALLRQGQLERTLGVGRRHLDRYYPYLLALSFNEGQVVRYSPVYVQKYIDTLPRYRATRPKLEASSLPRVRAFAASEEGRLAVAESIEDFNAELNFFENSEENPLTVKDFRSLANLSLNVFVKWEDDVVETSVVKHKRRISFDAINDLAAWRYPEPQIAPPDQPAVWQTPIFE